MPILEGVDVLPIYPIVPLEPDPLTILESFPPLRVILPMVPELPVMELIIVFPEPIDSDCICFAFVEDQVPPSIVPEALLILSGSTKPAVVNENVLPGCEYEAETFPTRPEPVFVPLGTFSHVMPEALLKVMVLLTLPLVSATLAVPAFLIKRAWVSTSAANVSLTALPFVVPAGA